MKHLWVMWNDESAMYDAINSDFPSLFSNHTSVYLRSQNSILMLGTQIIGETPPSIWKYCLDTFELKDLEIPFERFYTDCVMTKDEKYIIIPGGTMTLYDDKGKATNS